MKRHFAAVLCFLLALICVACVSSEYPQPTLGVIDATQYGLSTSNSGKRNAENLQALIDRVSQNGGMIYIPAGEYRFAENGDQTIGSHCIKLKSNVHIFGDGVHTVLKPEGHSAFGLDMFYYNEYLDTGEPIYLENCTFEGFVIDASETSCETYTSAGKGFMINLFRNCHWNNVVIKNTDATGFGVDCPINSSIVNCTAIGCGKAATATDSGASGFGIGFGYSVEEQMRIENCYASDSAKFGFFFEHQGRFDDVRYQATSNQGFVVTNCVAERNLYNFGGIVADNVIYEGCLSRNCRDTGYFFVDCKNCRTVNCGNEQDKIDYAES